MACAPHVRFDTPRSVVYTNSADSLEEIIEDIFEYYFDNEVVVVAIKKTENHIEVQACDEEINCKKLHKIDNHCSAVAEFLEFLAREVDRPDKFSIEEMC